MVKRSVTLGDSTSSCANAEMGWFFHSAMKLVKMEYTLRVPLSWRLYYD